ncbi:claudin-16-like isoform X2 [Hyla sarda]|nr:claudin-16-like isoform X2 [Hyla sarda]XP_056398920.1 claudin-16-like isoform X2 [Hyla sarda]XP_056398921.1 claudin-16-like isoform X2 [Hyla sarda]XP_056398922.1 claudin-16-like isoform X2 [Hyla sarda]XP_056398923.1 claudin-16-like isoform X2 [Hyla sarda]
MDTVSEWRKMGSTSVEVLCLVLVILSFLSFIVCSATDCWREDAKDPYSSVGLSSRCRGLWSECVYDNMANVWTCDIPISFLSEHAVVLVVTRALVIVNGILSIAVTPVLILGMKCTNIVHWGGDHKTRLCKAAGIMLLLGGVSGGIAVFWYAIDTALKYRTEVILAVPGITYELGYSYWFAASSALFTTIPALLIVCLHCRTMNRRGSTWRNANVCRSPNNAMTYL